MKEPELKQIEDIIRKIERSLLKIFREKPTLAGRQNLLRENYRFVLESKLFKRLCELYDKIPKKLKKGLNTKLQRGIVKISSDFFITVPELMFEKKMMFDKKNQSIVKRLFDDLAGQVVFCFCTRALLNYARAKQEPN